MDEWCRGATKKLQVADPSDMRLGTWRAHRRLYTDTYHLPRAQARRELDWRWYYSVLATFTVEQIEHAPCTSPGPLAASGSIS